MNQIGGVLIFFFALVFLLALSRQKRIEGFRGEAIGGRTAGPAATTYDPADYFEDMKKRKEAFRGESIGDRTEGPAASELNPAEFFQDEHGNKKEKKEGFSNFVGKPDIGSVSGPAPAGLTQPRKPYHLLDGVLKDAPRDTIGCLTAGCCNETDFEARTNLTGNYLQRTNNYKRSYPDNCTTPLHELTMSFYKTTPLSKQI